MSLRELVLTPRVAGTTFGNVGRFKLVIECADELVKSDPMFGIPRGRATRSILAKGEPIA